MDLVFVAGYFVIGFVLAVIWCYHNPYEYGMAVSFVIAWPLLLVIMFCAFAPSAVADFLRERFFMR